MLPGTQNDKDGLFLAAHGGILFLDEVADLLMDMQVKLLRAIQEKAVRPVGAQQESHIDVRILSATHKDLAEQVASGTFRKDLFFRINVIELHLPSLREHPEDIPLLVEHITLRLASQMGITPPSFDKGPLAALQHYPFPGNVRELENILERGPQQPRPWESPSVHYAIGCKSQSWSKRLAVLQKPTLTSTTPLRHKLTIFVTPKYLITSKSSLFS